jgi:quercetin dioxygenase-like cupin family protein
MNEKPTKAARLGALALVGGLGALVAARAAAPEQPIARTPSDAMLAWSACPDFMPAGCAFSVLHGDPTKPNADVFFKVPAGAKVPVHRHTSAERMVLIAGELEVTFAGERPTVLTPGMYAYGPAKLPHGGACLSASPCILFIAYEAPVDAMAGDGE